MNRDTYSRLHRWFDPIEPASEELYVEREDSAWAALAMSRLSDRPRAALLVGPQATGKSSELLYLARRLAREDDPPVVALLPLWRQYQTTELDPAKVLFLVALAVLRLAETPPPDSVIRPLTEAYGDAVALDADGPKLDTPKLLANLAVIASGALDGGASTLFSLVGAGAKALSDVPQLSLPGRSQRLTANDPRLVRIASALRGCVEWTRTTLAGAPLAVFVDGLDKLGQDNEDAFFGSAALAQPRCDGFQVVYAAPISTYRGLEHGGLGDVFDFLPVGNFRIFADRRPHDLTGPGLARMRQIVGKRLAASGVAPEDAFVGGIDARMVDDAIRASGGIPRFLVKILDRAFREATLDGGAGDGPATSDHVRAAIHHEAQNLVRRLGEDKRNAAPVLRDVLKTCGPPARDAQLLIRENLVLVYCNTYDWYRPSPLLDEFLALPAARGG